MTLLQIDDLWLEIAQSSDARLSVLHGVHLKVDRSEIVALVGETGSGKTLTAMSTLRLLPAGATLTRGRILLEGDDLITADDATMRQVRGRRIGYIFQQARAALNPTRRVGQQVADRYVDLLGVSSREAAELATTLLGEVGLPEPQVRGNQYPHQLSGGMCQRVMIALAIAAGPGLLLADEPTTGLDVTLQTQVLELLAELVRQNEMGMLLITHDLAVVAQNTQRIYVMYAGSVVESGPTSEVLQNPQHPYTRGLVGAVSSLEAGKRPVAIPGRVPRFPEPPAYCPFVTRCEDAIDVCRAERPPMRQIVATHQAACHVVGADAPSEAVDA